MIETILGAAGIAMALGLSASVYYRLGKVEEKVDFIYNNIHIAVDWCNNTNKRK